MNDDIVNLNVKNHKIPQQIILIYIKTEFNKMKLKMSRLEF